MVGIAMPFAARLHIGQALAYGVDKAQIGPFRACANFVGLARGDCRCDRFKRWVVVVDMKPISNTLALAIDGSFAPVKRIECHQ